MGRHLILRGVDRRLIKRLRDRGATLGLGAGEVARALLTEQLGERSAPTTRLGLNRRKPHMA